MMDINPYAAPQATKGASSGDERLSPPIWNPAAAAAWSLLFGPMFGAFLHMKNWLALGRPAEAATSRRWLVANALLFVLSLGLSFALPPSGSLNAFNFFGGIAFLLAWYFISARDQVRFVASTYGKHYQRRGWGKPLLYAVLIVTTVGIAAGIIGSLLVASRMD